MPLIVLVRLLMLQMQSFIRNAMVILTAPLERIGLTAASSVTRPPFGFAAMLDFIALVGIIMRNSVILADEIEHGQAQGSHPAAAIVEAVVQRTRPIPLTSAAIPASVPMAFSVPGGRLRLPSWVNWSVRQ